MNVSYSLDEQETVINIVPTIVSKRAEVFSCIPTMMKKLRKLYKDHPEDVDLSEKDGCVTATVPAAWIKIAPKRRCTLSDEQKRANAERLAQYMEANKK